MAVLLAASSTVLTFGLTAMPAQATDCEVNPFEAYQVAVKRGWTFHCPTARVHPGAIASTLFLPEPNGRLLCQWRTGAMPAPSSPIGEMVFFAGKIGDATRFHNGWRLKHYEVSGGNYTVGPPGTAPGNRYERLRAMLIHLDRHNATFNYRLTRLVLTKPNGVCAKVLDEAF